MRKKKFQIAEPAHSHSCHGTGKASNTFGDNDFPFTLKTGSNGIEISNAVDVIEKLF